MATNTKKVLLLVAGAYGKCAEVVELDAAVAKSLVKAGEADDNPDAIAAHEPAAAPVGDEVLEG